MTISPQTLPTVTSAVIRGMKTAKASCPVTVYRRLDDALLLIEVQAAEIERLRALDEQTRRNMFFEVTPCK
jgi:hypothetical protein